MIRYSAVYFDAHDLFYDLSQWRTWLFHSLAKLNIHISQWPFDPNPYSEKPAPDFWESLSDYLQQHGLNSGQALEFIHAARYSYQALITSTRGLPEATKVTRQLRASGLSVCIATQWNGNVSFEQFLNQIGFHEPIDLVAVCDWDNANHQRQHFLEQLECDQSPITQSTFVSCCEENLVAANNLGFGSVVHVPRIDAVDSGNVNCPAVGTRLQRLVDLVSFCAESPRRVA